MAANIFFGNVTAGFTTVSKDLNKHDYEEVAHFPASHNGLLFLGLEANIKLPESCLAQRLLVQRCCNGLANSNFPPCVYVDKCDYGESGMITK